jgi:hypothetical protein
VLQVAAFEDLYYLNAAQLVSISGCALAWWCHCDQIRAYPCPSRMATDILSMAPKSSDAESVFSSSRRTISYDRK